MITMEIYGNRPLPWRFSIRSAGNAPHSSVVAECGPEIYADLRFDGSLARIGYDQQKYKEG